MRIFRTRSISWLLILSLCVSLWNPIGERVAFAQRYEDESILMGSEMMNVGVGEESTEDSTEESPESSVETPEGGEEESGSYTIVLLNEEKELEQLPDLKPLQEFQLIPRLKTKDGSYVDEADFIYDSSDDGIVTVSETGLLTVQNVKETATVDIIITWINPNDENDIVKQVFSVKVTVIPAEEIQLEKDKKTLIVKETYTLLPTVLPEGAPKEVSYSSSDEGCVAVSEDGVVTALKEGSATITVTAKSDVSITTTIEITVIDIPVALELNPAAHSMKATDTFQMQAKLVYSSGKKEDVDATQLTYLSQNTTIVTVNESGLITALEQTTYPQVTQIVVTYEFLVEVDGVSEKKVIQESCQVTVTAIPVESIILENDITSLTMKIGDQYRLTPKIFPVNATNQKVTYTSSNTDVAKVGGKGLITAKSIGEATITVSSQDNPEIKVTFNVKVYQTQFNVAELGANGTDTKSDADAINKILKYASHKLLKDEMITVVVPNGTYYIDKVLTIYSNTNLCLDKNAVIKRTEAAGGSAMLRSKITDTIGGYDQCKNITVIGGTWDGNANGTKDSNCIYIGHAQNVIISDTTIKNNSGAHLLELTGVKNALIENVELYGYTICKEKGYTADQAEKEAIQIDYCSSASSATMKPHDLTPCENITIRNCKISDYMTGIGCHGSLPNVLLKNIRIENNKFNNITNACISMYNFRDVNVSGNTASGFTTFLYASSSTGSITGNTMKNKSFKKLTSSALQAANGITVSNSSNFKIEKNTIQKATSNGICVWNGSTATIKNNTIKGNGLYGIRTQGSAIKLSKNTLKNNKKGVYDTYKDANVKSSDDIRAYYIDIKSQYKYTGKSIKPKVKIKGLKKKYYSVSYKSNKRVGTATVTIKGKGKVKNTLKKKFKIVR